MTGTTVKQQSKCFGCPLFGDGSQQFYPDRIKPGSSVYLMDEQAGDRDPVDRVAKTYLPLSGLAPEDVSSGHAIRCTAVLPKPIATKSFDLGKRGPLEDAVVFCNRVHSGVLHGDMGMLGGTQRILVTQGDLALQAATGQRSAHEWRGWLLPYSQASTSWLSEVWTPGTSDLSVFATVSLADVAAMPSLTYCTRADWVKVGRVLRGEWPQPFPQFMGHPPKVWPRVSAFDTEFDPNTNELEMYSLHDGVNTWVVPAHRVKDIDIPEQVTVVMHQEDADIAHLRRFLKGGTIKTEDTVLMHAALWSDLPHTLAFLGSIYAPINRWKHLFRRNKPQYAAGDAIGTWHVYRGLVKEMMEDPITARLYREELFPLNPIIMEASTVGIRLDQDKVRLALGYHEDRRQEVVDEAQAYAGYPLLLSGPEQVARHLYELEGVGAKRR